MSKRRLIGVITIKNDIVVQSFGYDKYLPIGRPEIVAKNLDRWGADEIIVNVIDRSGDNSGPDYKTLEKILDLKLNTPIVYGGGISTKEDALKVTQYGADRIIIEKIMYSDLSSVRKISQTVGSQALIASMPVSVLNKNILQYNYLTKKLLKINDNFLLAAKEKLMSEIMLIDCKNEGYERKFNINLLSLFPIKNLPLICFGGISDSRQILEILKSKNVQAIAIGNSLNYKENSIQNIKGKISKHSFREPFYRIEN